MTPALLDTHSLIWTMDDIDMLSPRAADVVTDPTVRLVLSVGTMWEIGIKVGLGKLKLSLPYRAWMTRAVADLNLTLLPITLDAADVQSGLPLHHRDPFDRMLVAQAVVEQLPLVSRDDKFDAYGVTRIW